MAYPFRFLRILAFLAVLLSQSLCGQQSIFTQFDEKSGLHSNTIYALLEDSKGYLWIGTDLGLMRYNGHDFINIIGPSHPLSGEVYQIHEEKDGRIVCAMNNCRLIEWVDGEFRESEHSKAISQVAGNSSYIADYHFAENGDLDIVFSHTGSFRILASGAILQKTRVNTLEQKSDSSWHFYSNARSIESDNFDNTLKIAHFHKEAATIQTKQQKRIKVTNQRRPPHNHRPVFTLDNTVFSYHQNQVYQKTFDKQITFVEVDSEGSIFIGLIYGGIKKLSPQLKELAFSGEFFNDLFVTPILTTANNGLWIGTDGQGLFHMSSYVSGAKRFSLGDPKSQTAALFSMSDSLVEVKYNGDIGILDLAGDAPRISIQQLNGAKGITSFAFHDGWKHYVGLGEIQNRLFFTDDRFSVLPALDDRMCYGTKLKVIDGSLISYGQYYVTLEEKAGSSHIVSDLFYPGGNRMMIYDVNLYRDTLLFSTDEGVFFQNGIGELETWSGSISDERCDRFLVGANYALFSNNSGAVFGNYGGRDLKLDHFGQLLSKVIYDMRLDEGYLYLSTAGGLGIINLNTLESEEAVLESRLLNHRVYRSMVKDSLLYLSTDEGLLVFDKANYRRPRRSPQIFVEEVIAGGIRQFPSEKAYTLSESSPYIEINFSALDISFNGEFDYAYRCKAISPDWVMLKSGNLLLAQLDPGSYNVELRCARKGFSDSTVSQFTLNIPFEFYQRGIFKVLVAAALLLLVYLFIRMRITRANQRLVEVNNQLTLSQQVLQARMNPHLIFNALNNLKYNIKIGQNEGAYDFLSKFSNFLRQTFNYSRDQLISLSDELAYIASYCNLESMRIEGGIKLNVLFEQDIEGTEVMIPTLILQPLVENAIWHGLAHSDAEKLLRVTITIESEQLIVQVMDNGVGREAAKAYQIEGLKASDKDHALQYLKERLALLTEIDQKVHSLEIRDGSWEGDTGTTCRVVLPLKYKKEQYT